MTSIKFGVVVTSREELGSNGIREEHIDFFIALSGSYWLSLKNKCMHA